MNPADLKRWEVEVVELKKQMKFVDPEHPNLADVGVLIKACEYAMLHGEFFRKSDAGRMDRLFDLAGKRLQDLQKRQVGWDKLEGLQVRGFRSRVDDSFQPIGLVFPEQDAAKEQPESGFPLYVWLHGRGDKVTDFHFIHDRLDKTGQIAPAGAIVLHPFGRQCIGYKSAGETDVMEAIDFVCDNYPIDERRIVLMGFSMGGAGVWHLAAHYGERFVAASPGAGFAETARYQRLTPERFPAEYEQTLWKFYDVPGYVRNLFNFPVVAYSGENDKQIQAARVMEEAYLAEGRELTHLIGPGMGHKYHPDTLREILGRMQQAVEQGQLTDPKAIHIQSPHLRYARRSWLEVDGAIEQFGDTRIDALKSEHENWDLKTKNVSRIAIDASIETAPQQTLNLDGAAVSIESGVKNYLALGSEGWKRILEPEPIRKHPGLSGPMDDAFIDPFLVVVPSRKLKNPQVESWMRCELEYFKSRWRSLFRGELRIKQDLDVTDQDMQKFHLVLWGTPDSNWMMGRLLGQTKLPMKWTSGGLRWDNRFYTANSHILQLIQPNPEAPKRYIVVNTGPTFRPSHDRTNSLQNPKLPDWNILSLEETRNAEKAGKTVRCGFFNDDWQLDPNLTWGN
ncbi:MAG: prolyl oligopeptidase family serine peptidase [Planctomycetota bacterium]